MASTEKRTKFCHVYVETGNASEAYRQAFNTQNMKPATIKKRASELMQCGDIKGTIAELRAGHQKRHEVTVDSLTDQLIADRTLAHKIESPAAAVSASMGMGKLHGLIRDKADVNLNISHEEALDNLDDGAPQK